MKKQAIAICVLLLTAGVVSEANSAFYALTIGEGVDLTASGAVVDGAAASACINVTGTGSSIAHATLAHCSDDALNVGESFSYTDSASWCDEDVDCTITVAADKTLTGSNNAWRVAPAGDGTDSTTGNVVLAAYPFAGAPDYSNLGPKKAGQVLNAASAAFTDNRGRTGDDIGLYQHVDGIIKVVRKFFRIYSP
jgi:hypothetical protein